MAYTPTIWDVGDVITPQKMNNIEAGIQEATTSVGSVVITFDPDTSLLDKTFGEIYMLMRSGMPCYISIPVNAVDDDEIDEQYTTHIYLAGVTMVTKYDQAYRVYASSAHMADVSNTTAGVPSLLVFSATSANDFPTFHSVVNVNSSSCVRNTSL